jgi:hypothetical protein
MRGPRQERIESAVEQGAAALLGGATAFAAFLVLAPAVAEPARELVALALAGAAYWLSARVLRAVEPHAPRFHVPRFDLPPVDWQEVEELVLTDADRLQRTIAQMADVLILTDADRFRPVPDAPAGELILDDVLAQLGPDSRVVRLFDPAAMPTPGQLNARIEQHLRGSSKPAVQADASQALFDALADLRRSLR